MTQDDVAAARAVFAQRLRPRRDDVAPTVLGAGHDDLEPGREYLAALADGGWLTPTWPREYGGRGLTPTEAGAILRELDAFETPDLYPYLVGLHVVAPTLLAVATPEQCARWLPPLQRGDEIWCQLFSEPTAGSDLANLSTRAERDGDEWRLTGQKVWTSRGHYSRWGLALTRSDPAVPKHRGVTAFALDMTAPGVDVRPLRQINGDRHFCEVFLNGAPVPDRDRIGGVGEGWTVTRTALANERGSLAGRSASAGLGHHRLFELARSRGLAADPRVRDRLAALYVEAEVQRLTARRARAVAQTGQTPGPEGSGAKLRGSRVFKDTANLALDLLGAEGLTDESEWQLLFLTAPSISIRGGTDEIQRNIVGERVLGLPAEPRVDIERPWNETPR